MYSTTNIRNSYKMRGIKIPINTKYKLEQRIKIYQNNEYKLSIGTEYFKVFSKCQLPTQFHNFK